MSDDFESPSSSTGIQIRDFLGSLFLIEVLAAEREVQTINGPSDAIRANVSVVDGPGAGEQHDDVLLFGLKLQGQLRGKVGKKVLGRLGQSEAKPGKNPAWQLSPATEEDTRKARDYVQRKASEGVTSAEAPF